MKKTTTLLIALVATLTLANADELTGQKIFDTKCVACHTQKMPEKMSEMKDMKAPPMAKVSAKIKHSFDNNKTKVIAFIADYIENPSQEKVQCMAMAVKKFGLMPPIGKGMTKEEREVVATWVFENFDQKWENTNCKSGHSKGKMNAEHPGKCGGDKKDAMKCGHGKCGKGKSASEKPSTQNPSMKCGQGKMNADRSGKCAIGKCGGK